MTASPDAPKSALTWHVATAAGIYTALGGLSAIIALELDYDLFVPRSEASSWLGAPAVASASLSAGMGVVVACATVVLTRVVVQKTRWARDLVESLRPVARQADERFLGVMALASGIGEELLFRGLLAPLVGIVASSVAFAVLHQAKGRARWTWMAWAAVMGLVFASIHAATGSLVGPIVAHVTINWVNLRFLRDAPVDTTAPRGLGGLLARR